MQTKFSGLSRLLIFVLVFMGYGVLVLTGCGGGGGDDDDGSNGEPPPPPPPPSMASVAGTLSVGEGQVLDGDTNDSNDPVIDNDTMANGGQVVSIPVNIGGYADSANDEFDIYRVTR